MGSRSKPGPDRDHIARLLGRFYDPHYHDYLPQQSTSTEANDVGWAYRTTVNGVGGGKTAKKLPVPVTLR